MQAVESRMTNHSNHNSQLFVFVPQQFIFDQQESTYLLLKWYDTSISSDYILVLIQLKAVSLLCPSTDSWLSPYSLLLSR